MGSAGAAPAPAAQPRDDAVDCWAQRGAAFHKVCPRSLDGTEKKETRAGSLSGLRQRGPGNVPRCSTATYPSINVMLIHSAPKYGVESVFQRDSEQMAPVLAMAVKLPYWLMTGLQPLVFSQVPPAASAHMTLAYILSWPLVGGYPPVGWVGSCLALHWRSELLSSASLRRS